MNRVALLGTLAGLTLGIASLAQAQVGTAVTYQGQVKAAGNPVNGLIDVRFTLFDAATDGVQVGSPITRTDVPVLNGIFTAAPDFGAAAFASDRALWMRIEIANPAGTAFVTLPDRQRLTPAPHSLSTRGLDVAASNDVTLRFPGAGQTRVLGLPQGDARGSNLLIQAGGTTQSGGAGATGGSLILRAGNTNQSAGVAPPIGQSNNNDVVIQAGENTFSGAFGSRFSGNIRFIAGDSGTGSTVGNQPERMRILGDTGHVGVGNTDPAFRLDVTGRSRVRGTDSNLDSAGLWYAQPVGGALTNLAFAGMENDSNWGVYVGEAWRFRISDTGVASFGGNLGFHFNVNGGATSGNLAAFSSNDPNFTLLAIANSTAGPSANHSLIVTGGSNPLGPNHFIIRNVQAAQDRMIIRNDGTVGIGTSTPTAGFRLDVAGNIRCVNLTQTSTRDFKQDITPLSNALDSIMKLNGVSYAWNNEAPEPVRGSHDIGFIAEEVNDVLPDIVAKDENGKPVGIDYGKITPVAVEAIKQLKAENDDLKARLAKIEALLAEKAK
ncbi:MAG: tail fiber domain-containing protein [Planctomycetota bacterium]|nr:tail fiber domain-containing protein [Planctomycetota bacterium]